MFTLRVQIVKHENNWLIDKQLEKVREFFAPHVNIEFSQRHIKGNIEWGTEWEQYIEHNWIWKNVIEGEADCYVLCVDPENWEPANKKAQKEGWLGFTLTTRFYEKYFVALQTPAGSKRKRNRGWADNDGFAGTLRHELMHVVNKLNYKKDEVHLYDYEKKDSEGFLDYIDWAKCRERLHGFKKHPVMPLLDERKTGYVYGQKTASGVLHSGEDLNTGPTGYSDLNFPVQSPYNGKVEWIGHDVAGWGNMIVIYHPELNRWSRIAHLTEVHVKEGQILQTRDIIGLCGGTSGRAKDYAPHVHYDCIIKRLPSWTSYTSGMEKNELKKWYASPYKKHEQEKAMLILKEQSSDDWFEENTRPFAETLLKDVDGFLQKTKGGEYILEAMRKLYIMARK